MYQSILFCFVFDAAAITMGLQKHYFKYGQSAREKIFGIPRDTRTTTGQQSKSGSSAGASSGGVGRSRVAGGVPSPLSMLISQGTKFNSSKWVKRGEKGTLSDNDTFHLIYDIPFSSVMNVEILE